MFAEQSHICYPTHSCTGTCLVIPLFSFSASQYSFTHLFCFSRTIYSRPVKRPLVQDIHPQQPRSMQTFVNYLSISSNPFYFGVLSSFSGFQLFLTVSRRWAEAGFALRHPPFPISLLFFTWTCPLVPSGNLLSSFFYRSLVLPLQPNGKSYQ